MDFFNISPLDNRYYNKVSDLRFFLSDYGINKIRFDTEIAYFKEIVKYIHGYENPDFNLKFNEMAFNRIKEIEKTTNHDIKAIEYYIREKLLENKENDYYKYHNLIHFALTSQDINSFTNSLSVKLTVQKIILPKLLNITAILEYMSYNWTTANMLSRTHGQPAVTTSMGKELEVFNSRLLVQIKKLSEYQYSTKFGGAVGNLNAHYFSYPGKHWELFMNYFCNKFELKRNKVTTQIDHYDNLTEIFDIVKRINTILIDLSVDIWMYISINYFKLKTIKTEVGSSTMPHKVNPINFENSEGNLYMANGVFSVFSNKLPISRYQRDLSDSTIARNFGVAFGYSLLAYESLITGLNKLEINREVIDNDLNENWSILTEAIQCVMKTEGKDNAYELIKEHSRGATSKFDQKWYLDLVNSLDISTENKERLQRLTPTKYF